MKFAIASLVLFFIVPTVLVLQPAARAPEAEVRCSAFSGQAGTAYNVLVIGESWARGSRILPGLQGALSQRLGNRKGLVCTVAFSGDNTKKIERGIQHEIQTGHIARLFQGQQPDSVLLLNGVNDQVQHIGATAYAEHTAKIVGLFAASRVQVVSLPTVGAPPLPVPVRFKNNLQRWAFDGGRQDVRSRYSEAALRLKPQLNFIPYADFMPAFDQNRYVKDGIHLTDDAFGQYGRFLGSRIDIGSGEELAFSPVTGR